MSPSVKQPKATHLDVGRSLVVASPAGSGKTQKLAERYVVLLESGVLPERILAITFTEKAAAEMKERVLRIIRERLPELHRRIQPKLSRFRIMTVHAFARSVLERFAFELDLAPNLEMIDAIQAELMREEVVREGLVKLGSVDSEAAMWVRHLTLTERWSRLMQNTRSLFQHTPQSYMAPAEVPSGLTSEYLEAWRFLKKTWGEELWQALGFAGLPSPENEREHLRAVLVILNKVAPNFLTQKGTVLKRVPRGESERESFFERARSFHHYFQVFWRWHSAVQTKGLVYVFKHLAQSYEERKRAERVLDFADLEYKLYRVLYHSYNWSNVLASFDEQTDHILLDEFQDTNGLQWAIVAKLIEEWRAGMGAKQEMGKIPTIFLVGDVRQSIYLFRGANVEVFNRAARELEEWMGAGFEEVIVRENYRSLPVIVDFCNALFSRLMKGGETDWQTTYEEFSAVRDLGEECRQGRVEIILTTSGEDKRIGYLKEAEASNVAAGISGIVDRLRVFEKIEGREVERTCRYRDIMILLRRRTHLARYEDALRKQGIPFVVVQGTGFHASFEVVLLRQLVRFLSNPAEDVALYGILRSPLCGLSEEQILRIALTGQGQTLWEKVNVASEVSDERSGGGLSENEPLKRSIGWLGDTLKEVDKLPASILFEKILVERRLWSWFSDKQEAENIHKFLRLLEEFDREGLSLFRVAERLERMSTRHEEPKAGVSAEGMDAVRIMTIHAAKGLDSPVVFLVGLDERTWKPDRLAVREEAEKVFLTFTDSAYKEHPEKLLWEAKQEEEQKRLFYVACTRARDALFLSGVWKGKATGWLSYLVTGLGMREVMGGLELPLAPQGVKIELRGSAVAAQIRPAGKEAEPSSVVLERKWLRHGGRLRTVSDEIEESYHRSKGLWRFGEIVHAVLDRISNNLIEPRPESVNEAVRSLILAFGLAPSRVEEYQRRVNKHIERLRESGLLDEVIAEREDAASEVGFVFRRKGDTYTGRIDRVLIFPDGLHIIDYKSFPSDAESVKRFKQQLELYAAAAALIYNKPVKRCSLLFTADAKMVEVDIG